MRLDDEQISNNVEDRRSEDFRSGFGGFAGMGRLLALWPLLRPLLRTKTGWVLIVLGLLFYFTDPLGIFHHTPPGRVAQNEKSEALFIKKVLKTTEEVWGRLLPKYGLRYSDPTLVLYRGYTSSGCGTASNQVGPFYCPVDQKIYLDLNFFEILRNRHHAQGDFAQAYVLAHEVGHHVQDILGILQKIHKLQQRALVQGDRTLANHLQIPVELQADCFAGVWAHYVRDRLDRGDIEEAINTASKIGDDTLQKEAQGYVVPDSFTHGTSRQRVTWFLKGYKSGDLRSCNTFER